jgi:hypothetical protein
MVSILKVLLRMAQNGELTGLACMYKTKAAASEMCTAGTYREEPQEVLRQAMEFDARLFERDH